MILTFLFLLFFQTAYSQETGTSSDCPMVRSVPERLPDLNIPRSGHTIFYAGGELIVVGGHTAHFVPTQSAEYFADGKWHQLPTAYSHDNGFAVVMQTDEVIIGGGHQEPLGVGQTYMVERYTPATHSFEGFGSLDRRRVLTNGTQLGDGRVIISGNNYADDAIACYDGRSQVQHLKNVRQGRSIPYILPIAPDNAIIIGPRDTHQCMLDTVWADHVKGDAFRVPLLEQWKLLPTDQPFSSKACAIDDHAYLLTATDSIGQLGIIMLRDTCFSLLPTACPVPRQGPFGPVFYKGPVVVDRKSQYGYVMAVDSLYNRQYILAINYAHQPAALTLYYTDTLENATITIPIMTPDGDLILAGGIPNDNYKPLSAVWLYHFGTAKSQQASVSSMSLWLWILLAVVSIALLAYLFIYICHRHQQSRQMGEQAKAADNTLSDEELIQRICQLIECDQRYLTSPLKPSDISILLGVSTSEMTDCISRQRHCTFAQLIAEYRVRHAQQLLIEQPDIKLSELIASSGFTSESTFFRTFKAVTGLSPKEWVGEKNDIA